MANIKTGKKANADPVEKPKKLPAEFPEKFGILKNICTTPGC